MHYATTALYLFCYGLVLENDFHKPDLIFLSLSKINKGEVTQLKCAVNCSLQSPKLKLPPCPLKIIITIILYKIIDILTEY